MHVKKPRIPRNIPMPDGSVAREQRRGRADTYARRMVCLSPRDLETEELVIAEAAKAGRRPSRSVIVALAYEALRKQLQGALV